MTSKIPSETNIVIQLTDDSRLKLKQILRQQWFILKWDQYTDRQTQNDIKSEQFAQRSVLQWLIKINDNRVWKTVFLVRSLIMTWSFNKEKIHNHDRYELKDILNKTCATTLYWVLNTRRLFIISIIKTMNWCGWVRVWHSSCAPTELPVAINVCFA